MADELAFDMLVTGHRQAVQAVGQVAKASAEGALKIEAANLRVEKATVALTKAEDKHGKESLEARSATLALAQSQQKLDTAMAKSTRATDEASDGLDGFKLAAAGVATAAAAGLGVAVSKALDIEAANAKLKGQLALTGPEAQRFGKIAGDLYAHAYGESLDQVNEALRNVTVNIGKLGDEGANSLQNVTAEVLNLASAFDQDLFKVTQAIGSLLRNGLAKDAQEAIDIITFGFQKVPGAADDLLDTFIEYSVQFKALGLNGEQALSFISAAMQGGARNTDIAADALKEFNLRARDTTNTGAQQALEQLGFNAEDTARKIAGGGNSAAQAMAEILTRLRAVEDPAQRSALSVALLGTQAEDLQQALFAVDPKQFISGLNGVTGSAKGLDSALGSTQQARIESYKRSVEQFIASAGSAPGPLGAAAAATVAFGGSVVSAGADLAQIGLVSKGLPGALKGVGSSFAATARRGQELASTNAKVRTSLVSVGVAAGVVGVAVPLASAGFEKIHDALTKVPPDLESTRRGLEDFAKSGYAAGSAADALGTDFSGVVSTAKALDGVSGKFLKLADNAGKVVLPLKALDKPLEDQREGLKAVDEALADLAKSGNADVAAQAFSRLAAEAERQGLSVDDLKKQLPAYSSALEGVAGASQSAGTAAAGVTGAVQGQGESAQAAADAMKKLADETDAYTSSALEARGSARAFEAAIDDAAAATKENGRTLDITTAKGRANADALDDIAKSGVDMAQATLRNGGSQQQFQAQLERTRTELIKAGTRMGLTKAQAKAYADQVLRIPAAKNTRITANVGQALGQIAYLRGRIRALDGSTITVYARQVLSDSGVRFRAAGGPVTAGKPYVVGEHHAELFVPDTNGRIMPSVPRAMAASGSAGGGAWPALVIESSGTRLDDLLVEILRRAVRAKGGGDVQRALGRPS